MGGGNQFGPANICLVNKSAYEELLRGYGSSHTRAAITATSRGKLTRERIE